jgi:protoporphyrin/coproporphyrin ferrochelatase
MVERSFVPTKKSAIVLINLGTPAAPTLQSVRQFLRAFLSDPRVVELPRVLWLTILYGIILPFRPKKALKAYQLVWTADGSPLKVITEKQVAALAARAREEMGDSVEVVYAMTYGEPGIEAQINALRARGISRFILMPLYPQYSATTTAPIYDQWARYIYATRHIAEIFLVNCYFDRKDYIKALAASVKEHWHEQGKNQKLLFSFHGIPQRCVDLGDPYYDHCVATANAVANELAIPRESWAISFQSRLGKAKWLQPYTDKLLVDLAKSGTGSVDVICPAFSADCIETLEEIQGENQELFLHSGGEKFSYIPCLNDRADHIEMMWNMAKPLLLNPNEFIGNL